VKILVWQWGSRGAGPRFGACLAEALRGRPGIDVALSLCRDAEIMTGPNPPCCEMPVRTYRGMASFLLRLATAPLALPFLLVRLRRFRPDLAICAMPGPLDLLMAVALRALRTRLVVVVHDADAHPGDGFPLQMTLQRLLCRCADGLAVLCRHVGARLQQQGLVGNARQKLIRFEHPPFAFDTPATGWEARTGREAKRADCPPRLLCFGRLLAYKGLDLLAEALASLPPDLAVSVRVVGSGPESPALQVLRGCRGVTVENRWVPETEIGALLAWSDVMILPYRDASQSGVAAAALAAGLPVIATRVGGLEEQLAHATRAVLCEPDAESLAGAIRQWLQTPIRAAAPVDAPGNAPQGDAPLGDAATAWRQAVSRLLLAIGTELPLKSRPSQWSRSAEPGVKLAGAPMASSRLRRQ
jgi:glycosyltransferase involved in cell wall biosynthesis